MPIYCEEKTIPAGTTEAAPVTLDILVRQKFITKMEVGFAAGCNYTVGIKIQYGIRQFWPERRGAWLIGNNETISWDERYEMPSAGEKLTVFGASPKADYDHTIVVRIMTLPTGFYFMETIVNRLYKLWRKII